MGFSTDGIEFQTGDCVEFTIKVNHSLMVEYSILPNIDTMDFRATRSSTENPISSNFSTQRAIVVEYANISDATLKHVKGWSILFGATSMDTGLVDNPRHSAVGEKTLCRAADDG